MLVRQTKMSLENHHRQPENRPFGHLEALGVFNGTSGLAKRRSAKRSAPALATALAISYVVRLDL
jgi:hypothetical protein